MYKTYDELPLSAQAGPQLKSNIYVILYDHDCPKIIIKYRKDQF